MALCRRQSSRKGGYIGFQVSFGEGRICALLAVSENQNRRKWTCPAYPCQSPVSMLAFMLSDRKLDAYELLQLVLCDLFLLSVIATHKLPNGALHELSRNMVQSRESLDLGGKLLYRTCSIKALHRVEDACSIALRMVHPPSPMS